MLLIQGVGKSRPVRRYAARNRDSRASARVYAGVSGMRETWAGTGALKRAAGRELPVHGPQRWGGSELTS